MTRRRRGPIAPLVGALVGAVASVLLPGTAAADVTVAASRAEAGARDVTITFRVTNADPAVPTTRLEVFLPTVRPLLGVVPTAPAGWTARVATTPAAPEVASAVVWEGGALTGAGYAVFPIDVDRLPDGAGPLRFRVVATAAGATEEWSDLLPAGRPAPAHPALVVAYGAPAVVAAVAPHHHGDPVALPAGGGRAGGFAGLAVAAVGLVAVAAAALGRRQRRRFAALREERT